MIRTARALLLPALLASCAPTLATQTAVTQVTGTQTTVSQTTAPRSATVQAPAAAPDPAAPVPATPFPAAAVAAGPAPVTPLVGTPPVTPAVPVVQLPATQAQVERAPVTQAPITRLPAARAPAVQATTQPAAAADQSSVLAQAAPQRPGSPEAQLLARLNTIRAAGVNCPGSGVRPPAGALTASPTHAAAAYLQASYMARTGVISHDGPGGSTPRLRATSSGIRAVSVTEIIYLGGPGIDPEAAMQWWLHSPTHCFYMTDRRYSSAGASVVRGPHGAAYVMVLTSAPH